MADEKKLTEEEQKEIDKVRAEIEEQQTRLGEIYSQCWESEEFKKAFIENPKAIFDEYEVNYLSDKEYIILDTPEKTIIQVLPYKNVKSGVHAFTEMLNRKVSELSDDDSAQILLEGWKYEIYQNTEDVLYLPIPLCPEELSAEELELVNGGCLVSAFVFIFEGIAIATTIAVAAEGLVAVIVAALAAAGVEVGAVAYYGVAIQSGAVAITTVVDFGQLDENMGNYKFDVFKGWYEKKNK